MVTLNEKIVEARIPLARIANTDLPLPLTMQIAPFLAECEAVIEKAEAYKAQEGGEEDLARYLKGVRDLPVCVIPALPEFRMSYVDLKRLDGIVTFEEVG